MTTATYVNPLREGLGDERVSEPCVMVIFGASGDLTRRKLMPALHGLARERLLPAGFTVVGFARRDIGDDGFRQQMRDAVGQFSKAPPNDDAWRSLEDGLYYVSSNFADAGGYQRLGELLERLDRERNTYGNRIFYLATPPSYYSEIVHQLGEAGLAQGGNPDAWTRIIVEKPFGHDLTSARDLNRALSSVFREEQIFRMDHYLGKETVQNLLVFRFANGIFEPVWNRRYVDHVQISVAESVGIEGRGGYYEETGASRDMVQNHLMQLLSLVAMEPPASFDAESVRDEKVKLLRAVQHLTPAEIETATVRGQYGPGAIAGQVVPAYRAEAGVAANSPVETFVALRLFIENWRWADVPFYLRVGKRLPKRVTEIAVQFRRAPLQLFDESGDGLEPNMLALRIQPDEGITLRFAAKLPGPAMRVRPVSMDFRYGTSFGVEPPEAYERLLLDAMLGDSTLFTRWDAVEVAWGFVTQILEGWAAGRPQIETYDAGSWGPDAADRLIEADGRRWRRL
jgi:glucose-6-phosphate 1-dehydrogenase